MKRICIKKLFLLTLSALMMTMLLSCSSDGGGGDDDNASGGQESVITMLTVKNASSYTLYDVKWDGTLISSSAGIDSGASAKKSVSKGFGYIYFAFYPNGSDERMQCYTATTMDISNGDEASFTFTNNTVVVQLNNVSNQKILDKIQFPSSAVLSLTFDGRVVEKNDIIDLGKLVTNSEKTAEFSMTNSGKDLLRFIGNAPVISSNGCIEISSQPENSTLRTNGLDTFKISCSSSAVGSYTSDISIASNDETSPYTFTVKYTVAEPAPELSVQYDGETVGNEGTVDFGQVTLEKSKTIEILLLNTGTKKLTLTGSPSVSLLNASDCFEIVSQPIPEISAGNSSKCMIRYTPTQEGEESAILKIASNDPEKENTYICLKGSGLKVYPSFTVYKSTTSTTSSDIVREKSTITYSEKIRKDDTATWNFKVVNTSSEVDLSVSIHTGSAGSNIFVSNADIVVAPGSSGTFAISFNPDGLVGAFSDSIILTTNCETPKFTFTVSFNSREFGTEALLSNIYDLRGTVSPIISSNEKSYVVTFDSSYDKFSIRRNDVSCSSYASVYFDEIILEISSKSFGLSDGRIYNMRIVSEDGLQENTYTFKFAAKANYDDTSFSKFYLKKTSGAELDITTSLASGIYYTKNYTFSLKPVLNNPNAKVYIGAQGRPVDNMICIENNSYSSSINLMDYSYDGVLKVAVVSESELKIKWFYIIAE